MNNYNDGELMLTKNKFVVNGKDFGNLVDKFQIEMLSQFIGIHRIKLPSDCNLVDLLDSVKFRLALERGESDPSLSFERWKASVSPEMFDKWIKGGVTKERLKELRDELNKCVMKDRVKMTQLYLLSCVRYSDYFIDTLNSDYGFIDGFVAYMCCVETPRFKQMVLNKKVNKLEDCVEYVEACLMLCSDVLSEDVMIKGKNVDAFKLNRFLMNSGYDVSLKILHKGSETEDGVYSMHVLGFGIVLADMYVFARKYNCEVIEIDDEDVDWI